MEDFIINPVGVERDITQNFCIKVEGGIVAAITGRPANPFMIGRHGNGFAVITLEEHSPHRVHNRRNGRAVNRLIIDYWDGIGRARAFKVRMSGTAQRGWCPLGINHQVCRRHRLIGKVEGYRIGSILKPTLELVNRWNT